jgi:hypothetical protein
VVRYLDYLKDCITTSKVSLYKRIKPEFQFILQASITIWITASKKKGKRKGKNKLEKLMTPKWNMSRFLSMGVFFPLVASFLMSNSLFLKVLSRWQRHYNKRCPYMTNDFTGL